MAQRKAWLIAIIVAGVLALVALACSEPSADVRQSRGITARDLTTSPEPTSTPTMTPTPSATPTRTVTPSPTMQASNAGIHVYDAAVWNTYNANCGAAVTAGAPETWSQWTDAVWQNPIDSINLYICNMSGAPKTCTITADWFVTGYSEAFLGVFGCYGTSNWCLPNNNFRTALPSTHTQPCTIGGNPTGGRDVGAYINTLTINAINATPAPLNGAMVISLSGGGLAFGACTSAGSYMQAAVDCGAGPTPTPTITPTPSPMPYPAIINEVYPNPGQDLDGNGATDLYDQAVELYGTVPGQNVWLNGWIISDGVQSYTLPTTKLVAGSYKVMFPHDLRFFLPVTGTLTLTAPTFGVVDTFPYTTTQTTDRSCARRPDGGAIVCDQLPSIGKTNP
jgi:hypothetical protein